MQTRSTTASIKFTSKLTSQCEQLESGSTAFFGKLPKLKDTMGDSREIKHRKEKIEHDRDMISQDIKYYKDAMRIITGEEEHESVVDDIGIAQVMQHHVQMEEMMVDTHNRLLATIASYKCI